jgi:hypothetical protein
VKRHTKRGVFLTAMLAALCVVGLASTVLGQATTGNIAGRVVLQSDQSLLPGVMVEAVHVPTGTRYRAVTQDNGRFNILNVRVGGPYSVTATLQAFKTQRFDDVTVGLGETRDLNFELQLESVVESVLVTAEAAPLISPDRTGSRSSVTADQIMLLPTVRRQIQDFARLNPYFATDESDSSGTRLAVAGKNNRYNTIQIDGAVNNDLFGLADTGTPGGQADAQPISLDAIQELQLVVSPYDIKQGGFTGGGINAITRSGSNQFAGSVYGSMRDQKYVGDGPYDTPVSDFSEDQYGGSIGGPIMKDTLFFFVSGEINRKKQPTGVAADGTGAINYNNPTQAAAFRNLLISKYDYDPGSLGDYSAKTDSDLFFARLDYNLSSSHQATLRHNYVKAFRDVIADRSRYAFRFPTSFYGMADKTNSSVFQLNSIFGSNSFNVGRIGYQTIRDVRSIGVTFPTVDIGPTARSPQVTAGTERFSGANSLDQDVLEVTDDFTFVKGDHTITLGTHNEFFDFKNLYLPDYFGWYKFNTVEDFEKGVAQEYSITFANGSDPKRPTSFGAEQYGLYAGDQWRVADTLTFTLGIRADYPKMTEKPSYNAGVYNTFGINTSKMPGNMRTISPRLGFNWAPGKGQQVRGGIGIFAGRTPYVWISNAYANTGIETTSLYAKNVPFVADPNNQPKSFPPGTSAVSVDAIDPDFEFPRVMRTTLAYDRELPWGIRGTIEAMYTKTQQDVYYYNMNKVATGQTAFDGRPTYKNIDSGYKDIPYLSNTSKGEQTNISLQLEKRFKFGLYFNGSYAHAVARSAMDATSSRAISNWQYANTRGDIYKQELARTNWEIEHRFNFIVSESFTTGPFSHNIGLFYTVTSGQPYSILMSGDPNTDGYGTNDMIYIPNSTNDFILTGGTAEEWETFLRWTGADEYRGHIPRRNEFFAPWNRILDFHYDLTLPIKIIRTQVTFDILNLINLIDQDKGGQYYVSNHSWTPIQYQGIDSATGKPKYKVAYSGALNPGAAWSMNNLRSRWQLKLGLRVGF